MELNVAVAENLKRIRKTQKLSIERTAALAGVSRSMLGQIERGEANPSVAILEKLAAVLKVPAEQLLHRDCFEPLLVSRELEHKPQRQDGGRVMLRDSIPYEDCLRTETCFVDVYISGHWKPEPSVPGCVCTLTSVSGTAWLKVNEETTILQERDAMRFSGDGPWELYNQGNCNPRLLLIRQYRKGTE